MFDPCASNFNPLHCGAVVASRGARLRGPRRGPRFNPLHCGAVVASREHGGVTCSRLETVSIPFIAGQWSLLDAAAGVWLWRSYRFNPLHCGAVVASDWRGRRFPGLECSFNPLHCGAVVASGATASVRASARSCFNPLHCGAVVASRTPS